VWKLHTVTVPHGSLLFISTDGLIDQIGGPRKITFGKRRALNLILEHRAQSPSAICESLQRALADWQRAQTRRDDVTLFFVGV